MNINTDTKNILKGFAIPIAIGTVVYTLNSQGQLRIVKSWLGSIKSKLFGSRRDMYLDASNLKDASTIEQAIIDSTAWYLGKTLGTNDVYIMSWPLGQDHFLQTISFLHNTGENIGDLYYIIVGLDRLFKISNVTESNRALMIDKSFALISVDSIFQKIISLIPMKKLKPVWDDTNLFFQHCTDPSIVLQQKWSNIPDSIKTLLTFGPIQSSKDVSQGVCYKVGDDLFTKVVARELLESGPELEIVKLSRKVYEDLK